MAETPSTPSMADPGPGRPGQGPMSLQYWCFHCDKRVSVETLAGQSDVICNECKFGFVEFIPTASIGAPSPPSRSSDQGGIGDGPTLRSQFVQVLSLLAQVAREDDTPPPPPPPPPPHPRPLNPADPSPPSDDNDFLRIEIDGWDHDHDNDHHDNNNEEYDDDVYNDDEEEEDVHSVEIEGSDDEEREENIRRRSRRSSDVLRLRLRDFANRAARSEGRNRILDWAEILMGLEDNSIEFRFEMPETDRYIGNPGDYVDAAEYEALLQNLAEADGRRGAPPASKSAVENLKMLEVKSGEESYVCAICKDGVNVGEFVKEMPCGHGYHGDCIVPWLAARNSCPVCRFELPTDDPDYEEERKKKSSAASSGSSSGNSSSASA